VAPLGAGGMGEVYRARDTRLGREVAINVLRASFATDADRLRRFEQEARAVAALNHPNILAIHGIGENTPSNPDSEVPGEQAGDEPALSEPRMRRVEGRIPDPVPVRYLVTELLEGQTLAARIAEGPLPIGTAVDVGGQIVKGLAAAHGKHIVHLDRARELDPFSPYNSLNRVWYLNAKGPSAQAGEEGRRLFLVEPDNWTIPFNTGYATLRLGRPHGAVLDFEASLRLLPERPLAILGPLGLACGRTGRREDARRILAEMEQASSRGYLSPILKAHVLAGLGQKDEAFRLLEGALVL